MEESILKGKVHPRNLLGGGFKYILFSPRTLGKMNPFWRAYFSTGLVQPPPSLTWRPQKIAMCFIRVPLPWNQEFFASFWGPPPADSWRWLRGGCVFSNNELGRIMDVLKILVVCWKAITRWWQLKYVLFSSRTLGFHDPIWRAYVSKGLKPPTRSSSTYCNMGVWKTTFFSLIFFRQDCNPVDGNLRVTFFLGAFFPTPKSFPKNHGIWSHWWFGDPGTLLYRVEPCQTLLFLKCLMVLSPWLLKCLKVRNPAVKKIAIFCCGHETHGWNKLWV